MNIVLKSMLLLPLLVATANANLIKNGSFEDVSGSNAIGNYGSVNTWQIYADIPEWDANRNMEIWTNDFIVPAFDGDNILELNGHPKNGQGSFSIFQTFDTIVGQQYELSFAARKRQNSNERVNVSVGDLDLDIASHEYGSWNVFNFLFEATDITSTLQFTSLDRVRDTTGNLLDDIKVVAVPEPSILALMGLGIFGLGLSRRKM